MALYGKVIATGRSMNNEPLPVIAKEGLYFRNGDAAVADVVVQAADGSEITINNVAAGQVVDWMKVIKVVSTTATDWEIYLWK
jgi:hypothetical protein